MEPNKQENVASVADLVKVNTYAKYVAEVNGLGKNYVVVGEKGKKGGMYAIFKRTPLTEQITHLTPLPNEIIDLMFDRGGELGEYFESISFEKYQTYQKADLFSKFTFEEYKEINEQMLSRVSFTKVVGDDVYVDYSDDMRFTLPNGYSGVDCDDFDTHLPAMLAMDNDENK